MSEAVMTSKPSRDNSSRNLRSANLSVFMISIDSAITFSPFILMVKTKTVPNNKFSRAVINNAK